MKKLVGLIFLIIVMSIGGLFSSVKYKSAQCMAQSQKDLLDVKPWGNLLEAPPAVLSTSPAEDKSSQTSVIYQIGELFGKLNLLQSDTITIKKCAALSNKNPELMSVLATQHPLLQTSDPVTQLIHIRDITSKEVLTETDEENIRQFAHKSDNRNLWNAIYETRTKVASDWENVSGAFRSYSTSKGKYGREKYSQGLAEAAHASCELEMKRFLGDIKPWKEKSELTLLSQKTTNFSKTVNAFPEVFDLEIHIDTKTINEASFPHKRNLEISMCKDLASMETENWISTSDDIPEISSAESQTIEILHKVKVLQNMASAGNNEALLELLKSARLSNARNASNVAYENIRASQEKTLKTIHADYRGARGKYASDKADTLCMNENDICSYKQRIDISMRGVNTSSIQKQFDALTDKSPAPVLYKSAWGRTYTTKPGSDVCSMVSNYNLGSCSYRDTYDIAGGQLEAQSSAAFMGIGKVTTRYYLSELKNSYSRSSGRCRGETGTTPTSYIRFDGSSMEALMWRVALCNESKIDETITNLSKQNLGQDEAVKRIDQALKSYSTPAITGPKRIKALMLRAGLTGNLEKTRQEITSEARVSLKDVLDTYVDAQISGAKENYDAIVKRQGRFASIWDGSSASSSSGGSCNVVSINFDAGRFLGDSVASLNLSGPSNVYINVSGGAATLSADNCVTGHFSYVYTIKSGLFEDRLKKFSGEFSLPKNNGSCTVFPEGSTVQCY